MKKIVMFAFVLLLIFSLSACFDPNTFVEHRMSGKFSSLADRLEPSTWTFSAATANGYSARYIAMRMEDLENLRVEVTHEGSGTISLTIIQAAREARETREGRDEVTKTFDLTGGFSGYIDTSEVIQGDVDLPHRAIEGRTHFRLQFEHIENVDVVISWGQGGADDS